MNDKTYYIYVLRCHDNSLYTGITTDVKRRFLEHSGKGNLGAKYTRSKRPQHVEAVWSCHSRACASKLEYAFKHLTKENKEKIVSDAFLLNTLLSDKLDTSKYLYLSEYKDYKLNL